MCVSVGINGLFAGCLVLFYPDVGASSCFIDVEISRFERSAVADHAWKDSNIEWNEVKILDTAREERERRVKEALYIRLAPP